MPHPLSHKCPIPYPPLCLASHFMCVKFFHMVSIDVPAGVGAPPLNTTSEHVGTDKVCQPCQMGNPQHPSMDPPEDTRAPTTIIIA